MKAETLHEWIADQETLGRLYFTQDEVRSVFSHCTNRHLATALYRASLAKQITSAWQGFYLILPAIYKKQGTLPAPMYADALMKHLKRSYCVALINAAAFYGAAHQSPQGFTIMTSTPALRGKTKTASRLDFICKRELRKGIPTELLRPFQAQTGSIQVASPEWTALSLIQYQVRIGGLSRAVTVLDELLEHCTFDSLPPSILQYTTQAAIQRLGYILDEILNKKSQASQLFNFITKNNVKLQRTQLSTTHPNHSSQFCTKWKLSINVTLENDIS